jgi:hypothetical protein
MTNRAAFNDADATEIDLSLPESTHPVLHSLPCRVKLLAGKGRAQMDAAQILVFRQEAHLDGTWVKAAGLPYRG